MIGILLILASALSFAAADIPPLGKGQLFLGMNTYAAKTQFDANGDRDSFGNSGKFTKSELTYYAVYTIREKLAVLASGAALNRLRYEDSDTNRSFTGSGDQGLGLRYRFQRDLSGARAVQLIATAPAYSRRSDPGPGNRQHDLELRYLQDIYQLAGLDFITFEAGFRKRFSTPADQLRGDLSFGKNFRSLLLLGHVSYTKGLQNDDGLSSNTNPTVATDYDLLKVGPSVAWRYRSGEAIQVGFLQDVAGRNVGQGQALFTTWWKEFSL